MIQAYHAKWVRPKDTTLTGVVLLPSITETTRLCQFVVWQGNIPPLMREKSGMDCIILNAPMLELVIGQRCSFKYVIELDEKNSLIYPELIKIVVDGKVVFENKL